MWLGATHPDTGAGRFRIDGKHVPAHQVAWELERGALLSGERTAPCADVPTCVRIEHLRSTLATAPARQRSRRGTGSIRDLGDGLWELAVPAGMYDDGSRRREYRRVQAANRSEAAAHLSAFAAEVAERGSAPKKADRSLTFDRAAEQFLTAVGVGFLRGGARPPTALTVRYIDEHRQEFGVEPICGELQVAPSTYYAAMTRPPSARAISDAELMPVIAETFEANYSIYGAYKTWRALRRAGHDVGRDRVARLMRAMGLQRARRTRRFRTTRPDERVARPADLVDRRFEATEPNRLWVLDITYVATWAQVVYVCFGTQ